MHLWFYLFYPRFLVFSFYVLSSFFLHFHPIYLILVFLYFHSIFYLSFLTFSFYLLNPRLKTRDIVEIFKNVMWNNRYQVTTTWKKNENIKKKQTYNLKLKSLPWTNSNHSKSIMASGNLTYFTDKIIHFLIKLVRLLINR